MTYQDELISGLKRILSHHFALEVNKQRITDKEKNQELVNHLGSAFTIIEMNVKKDVIKFVRGADKYEVIPKRKDEE
jgi:hypothetical protein